MSNLLRFNLEDNRTVPYDNDLSTVFYERMRPEARVPTKKEMTRWIEKDLFPDYLKRVNLTNISQGIIAFTPFYQRYTLMKHIAPIKRTNEKSWEITVQVKPLELAEPTPRGSLPSGPTKRTEKYTQSTKRFAAKGEKWHVDILLEGGMERLAQQAKDLFLSFMHSAIQYSIECMLRAHGYNTLSLNNVFHPNLGIDRYWDHRKFFFNIVQREDRPFNEMIPRIESIQKTVHGESDILLIHRQSESKVMLQKEKHTDYRYAGNSTEGFDNKVNSADPVLSLMRNKIFSISPYTDAHGKLDDPLLNTSIVIGEYHIAGCRSGVVNLGVNFTRNELDPLIYDQDHDMDLPVSFREIILCSGIFEDTVGELRNPDFSPFGKTGGSGYASDLKYDPLSKDGKDPSKRVKIDLIGEALCYEAEYSKAYADKFLSKSPGLQNSVNAGYEALKEASEAEFDIDWFNAFFSLNVNPGNIADMPSDRIFGTKSGTVPVKVLKATDSTGSFYKMPIRQETEVDYSKMFGCHSPWALWSISNQYEDKGVKNFCKELKATVKLWNKIHPISEITNPALTPHSVYRADETWAFWSNLVCNNVFLWINSDYSSGSLSPLTIDLSASSLPRFSPPSKQMVGALLDVCPHIRHYASTGSDDAIVTQLSNELNLVLRSYQHEESSSNEDASNDYRQSSEYNVNSEEEDLIESTANLLEFGTGNVASTSDMVDEEEQDRYRENNADNMTDGEEESTSDILDYQKDVFSDDVAPVFSQTVLPQRTDSLLQFDGGKALTRGISQQMGRSHKRRKHVPIHDLLNLIVTVRLVRIVMEHKDKKDQHAEWNNISNSKNTVEILSSNNKKDLYSLLSSGKYHLFARLAAVEKLCASHLSSYGVRSPVNVTNYLTYYNPGYAFAKATDETAYISRCLAQFCESFAHDTRFVLDYFNASMDADRSVRLDRVGNYDPNDEYGNLDTTDPGKWDRAEAFFRRSASNCKAMYVPPYFRSVITEFSNQKLYIDTLLRILSSVNREGSDSQIEERLRKLEEIMSSKSPTAEACIRSILDWVSISLRNNKGPEYDVALSFFGLLGESKEDVLRFVKDVQDEMIQKKKTVIENMKKLSSMHKKFAGAKGAFSHKDTEPLYLLTAFCVTGSNVRSLYRWYCQEGYYDNLNDAKSVYPPLIVSSQTDPFQRGTLRDLEAMFEEVDSASKSSHVRPGLRSVSDASLNRISELYYGSMVASGYPFKSGRRRRRNYSRAEDDTSWDSINYIRADVLAEKELDKKLTDLSRMVSDPMVLAFARSNLLTPFLWKNIDTLMNNDLFPPFDFYLFKAWIRNAGNMAVKLKGMTTRNNEQVGGSGFIAIGNMVFSANSDAGSQDTLQHLSGDACFVVTDPQNIYVVPDCDITQYLGGCNTQLFDMRELIQHGTDYLNPRADVYGDDCSLLPVVAPIGTCSSKAPTFLDVTGRPHHMISINVVGEEALETPMYPTCYRACQNWGLEPGGRTVDKSKISPSKMINYDCLRGQTRYWDYRTKSYGDKGKITSYSLWGEDFTFEGAKALRSGTKTRRNR